MVPSPRSSLITNVPPSYYDRPEKEVQAWLDSKRVDDNVENSLWRIKNTLYDLDAFIERHPGGADWIRMTKGHDITEAFIVHHIAMEKVEPFLTKYRVKDTQKSRNSKLTFDDDGFYMTLRRKVIAKLPEIKKQTKVFSNLYVDTLFVLTLLSAILAQRFQSTTLAILFGFFLTWTGICGHNYLHQRDNPRMLYFNLLFMSYRDWRVSHVLSHHIYPNSLLDIELKVVEPLLVWFPRSKNFVQRYISYIYSPVFYSLLYLQQFGFKVYCSLVKGYKMYPDEFMPFALPLVMYLFGGDNSFGSALKFFLIAILAGGFIFGVIGFNAGHHHPDQWHDGDPIRKGYDWGLYSIDTIMERQELRGNTLLTLTNFGDHALHHLFPTFDHGLLPKLYDMFFETLLEFEAECQCYPWFFETIKGQFQQLSRTEPMPYDSHERYLRKIKEKTN